jgi:ABC-2 type transport system permease protein
MLTSMCFAALIMAAMEVAAATLGHVPFTLMRALLMAFINVFGVLPFCAMGLFIGTIVKGSAAPGFTNLV